MAGGPVIHFCVDQPARSRVPVYGDSVAFVGWAFREAAPPVLVRIEGPGGVTEVLAERARPDVREQFRKVAVDAPEGSGFRVALRAPRAGRYRVTFVSGEVVGEGGEYELFPFTSARWTEDQRAPGAGPSVPRARYKQVWDDAATDVERAKVAVAGYTSEALFVAAAERTVAVLERTVGIRPDDDVLEIGCGIGRLAPGLTPLCRHWTGVDVSENMLAHARARTRHLSNVTLAAVSGWDLGALEDESFDLVYCTVVFMHLDEWERYGYVAEAKRVLRPGGRIYIDNYNLLSKRGFEFFLKHAVEIHPLDRPPNISKSSTPDELQCYLERAGFESIEIDDSDELWLCAWATKAGALPEDRYRGRVRRARRDMERHHFEGALARWQAIIREFGPRAEPRQAMAECLIQRGRLDEAAMELSALVRDQPDWASGHVALGNLAMREGSSMEAERRFRHALELEPWHVGARAGLTQLRTVTDQLDEAECLATALAESEPKRHHGPVALGAVAMHRGKLREALALYSDAALRFPGTILAHAGVSEALLALGDSLGAERGFADLVERYPSHPRGHEGLLSVLALRGSWAAVLERAARLRVEMPGSLTIYLRHAEALVQLGRLDEAEAAYAALTHGPDRAVGHVGLSQVAMARCDWQKALAHADAAIRQRARWLPAHLVRGEALAALGRREEARVEYEAWLERAPHHPEPLAQLNHHIERSGTWRRAVTAWQRFRELFPGRIHGDVQLARAWMALGEMDEARRLLEVARMSAPEHPGPVDALVHLYELEGDVASALTLARERCAEGCPRSLWYVRIAAITERLEGSQAAVAAWRDAAERFPHHEGATAGFIGSLSRIGDDAAADALAQRALSRFVGSAGIWREAVWAALGVDPTPERGLRLMKQAFSTCGDHASLRMLEIRLHTLAYRARPPFLERHCDAIESHGDRDEVLGLVHLLTVIGAFEEARGILGRLSVRLDSVRARASLSHLRARLDFFDGEYEAGLDRLRAIDARERVSQAIPFPERPYAPPARPAEAPVRVAVLCHLFHTDLLDPLVEHLEHLSVTNPDYWFSLSELLPDHQAVRSRLEARFPGARFVVAPNAGFDIGGYFRILEEPGARDYELAFVLHTKKGAHALETGTRWRRHLLEAIAGTPRIVQHNVELLRKDPRVELVGSLTPVSLLWGVSHWFPKYVDLVARATGERYANDRQLYVPGTMFLTRMSHLIRIREIARSVTLEPYESLSFARRFGGTSAHAIEALFGSLIAYEGGEATYLTDPGRLVLSRP